MPTTANGIAYTVHSASVPGVGTIYYGIADGTSLVDVKTVLYMHGAGGAANDFQGSKWNLMRDWLIEHGWGFIEGPGGGLNAWGNAASESSYGATFDWVDAHAWLIAVVVVLGRSMGGAVADRLYNARRGADPRWLGLMNNSGVQDLVWAYDYDSGRWTDAFNAAWGVTSKAEFEAAVVGMNPIDGPPETWDGAQVLQLVGSADVTVLPDENGLAMRTMYAGHPDLDQLDVRPDGDHSTTNGSYKQVAAMSAFLLEVTGETPPDPGPSEVYRVVRRYILEDGRRRLLTPVRT